MPHSPFHCLPQSRNSVANWRIGNVFPTSIIEIYWSRDTEAYFVVRKQYIRHLQTRVYLDLVKLIARYEVIIAWYEIIIALYAIIMTLYAISKLNNAMLITRNTIIIF